MSSFPTVKSIMPAPVGFEYFENDEREIGFTVIGLALVTYPDAPDDPVVEPLYLEEGVPAVGRTQWGGSMLTSTDAEERRVYLERQRTSAEIKPDPLAHLRRQPANAAQ
jgi:hypothetical protein